ncbi:HlyD family efflux transporter periplasmic adaptor subunit [Paenibacillus filicis]|uniref:HlyD family efflux transporter periplasmic adaptor subunit n=1 Tax=Paenibacillus filicis TaxID=669464 RepID=A0ABU9DFX6_9BACL
MKLRMGLYAGLAVVLIAGGTLLAVKGKDAVSQAESRKQGVLEAEQTAVIYTDKPGTVINVNAAVSDAVKKGDILFIVKSAEGNEVNIPATADGQISRIAVKPGDQVGQGMPVAIVRKNTFYTDVYVQEGDIHKLEVNQQVKVHFPYLDHPAEVTGVVTSIAAAPQFASLRMTREKGQADLSMFQVRVSVDSAAGLLPGMTAEVKLDELAD